MEIDSKPEVMDKLDRKLIQYKIEREALKKETDAGSKDRLKHIQEEIGKLEKEYANLEEIWKAEKAQVQSATQLKEELEKAKLELVLVEIAKKENIKPEEEKVTKETDHLVEHYPTADKDRARAYIIKQMTQDLVFAFLEKQN
jgi:FKBP-type peptidyl-prolyl cis-trans isomerase (trigger factor)